MVPLRIMKTVRLTLDSLDRTYLTLPGELSSGFLDSERLAELAKDEGYDLDQEFLRGAAKKGDRCYAIFDGDKVASYGWYSRAPTHIDASLLIHFDPAFVYMYKGLTLPEYRGKRLHALGMARALEVYAADGAAGVLSYVDSNNQASLKSCYRMGYTDVGSIIVVGSGYRRRIWTTGDCADFRLKVTLTGKGSPAAPVPEA